MRYRQGRSQIIALIVGLLLGCVGREHAAGASEVGFALAVRDIDEREIRLNLNDLGKLTRSSVRAKDEKGNESVWQGTLLNEV